jgi:hypothetical protein
MEAEIGGPEAEEQAAAAPAGEAAAEAASDAAATSAKDAAAGESA